MQCLKSMWSETSFPWVCQCFIYYTPYDIASMQELVMQKQQLHKSCCCCEKDTVHIESEHIKQD